MQHRRVQALSPPTRAFRRGIAKPRTARQGFSTTRCDGSGQMCEQFSPATRARVTGGDHRDRQGPIDRKIWVVVRDPQILRGIVRAIDPITHVGSRGQCLEAV